MLKLEQDLRKSLVNKNREMVIKLLGVVNLLKTKVQINLALLK